MAVTILAMSLTKPACQLDDRFFDFSYLGGMADNYGNRVDYLRQNDMDFLGDSVYLDNAGSALYTASQIRRQMNVYRRVANDTSWKEVSDKVREHILRFFGAGSDYFVVLVPSATYGMKLVGESFRFRNSSVYHFMRWSHTSAVGLRKYAQINRIFEYENIPEAAENEVARNPVTLKKSEVVDLVEVPLEENFAGRILSKQQMIGLINGAQTGMFPQGNATPNKAIVMADAAAYAATNRLNLTETPFHIVAVSFHKMFGTPNYGALIVHRAALPHLKRRYRSSVSAQYILSESSGARPDTALGEGFEDYVVPEATLVGIDAGLSFLETLGMNNINSHVTRLRAKLVESLSKLQHDNEQPMITLYGTEGVDSHIVTFNVHWKNGSFVGYHTIVAEASAHNIHLRGGCMCNPGACYQALGLTEAQITQYLGGQRSCDCERDMADQTPLGAVRASLGWLTSDKDVRHFLGFLRRHFRNK